MKNFWETVGALLAALMALITVPLAVLNMFGGIISGIWLMVLGHWGQFALGIAILVGGSTLLGLVTMPSFPLQIGGATLMKQGKAISGSLLMLLAGLWTYFVIYIWCGVTFSTMAGGADGHMIPSALWGYANAVGPWSYMASKGGKEETGSTVALFAAQLGCVSMMVGVLFRGAAPTALGLAPYLAPFILLGVLAHFALGVAMVVETKMKRVDLFA